MMAALLPPITFISDDDVLEHILDISGGGTKRVFPGKRKASGNIEEFVEETPESDDDAVAADTTTPVPAVANHLYSQQFKGGAVHGADLFKLGAQWQRKSSLYTPGKSTAALSTAEGRKRRRDVAGLDSDEEAAAESGMEDGDGNSDVDSGDDEPSDVEDNTKSGRRRGAAARQPAAAAAVGQRSKASSSKKTAVQLSGHEEYFHVHGDSSITTSDATLSNLNQMDLQAVRAGLLKVPDGHKSHRARLHASHVARFPAWMLYLKHGFNVLLYGLGSKRELLEDFRSRHLGDCLHLVVNGYFPGLQFKDVLSQITEHLNCSSGFRTPADQCQFICDHYSKGSDELFLLIHCIDGVAMRNDKVQVYLTDLAKCKNIHLVASCDHINVPTMWDGSQLAQFNWLWQETHTFSTYTEETSYENSIMVRQTGKLVYTALVHVMESLTRNGRGIFKLLAQAELQRDTSTSTPGMAFQDLFSHCKEAFLVSSDQALRAQLTEFFDHKLVKSKKGQDGVEYICLAVEKQIVEQYLATLEDA